MFETLPLLGLVTDVGRGGSTLPPSGRTAFVYGAYAVLDHRRQDPSWLAADFTLNAAAHLLQDSSVMPPVRRFAAVVGVLLVAGAVASSGSARSLRLGAPHTAQVSGGAAWLVRIDSSRARAWLEGGARRFRSDSNGCRPRDSAA